MDATYASSGSTCAGFEYGAGTTAGDGEAGIMNPPSNVQLCSREYLPLRKSGLVRFQLMMALCSDINSRTVAGKTPGVVAPAEVHKLCSETVGGSVDADHVTRELCAVCNTIINTPYIFATVLYIGGIPTVTAVNINYVRSSETVRCDRW